MIFMRNQLNSEYANISQYIVPYDMKKELTLNRFSEKTGSPPASNLDPPVLRSTARIELLSLSAMYASLMSTYESIR